MTLLVGCTEVLFPAEGMGWILVIMFFLPLWLIAESAGEIVRAFLVPVSVQESIGRIPSVILQIVLIFALAASSVFTIELLKK